MKIIQKTKEIDVDKVCLQIFIQKNFPIKKHKMSEKRSFLFEIINQIFILEIFNRKYT